MGSGASPAPSGPSAPFGLAGEIRIVERDGDSLDLSRLGVPAVSPLSGTEVVPDGFSVLVGALVPVGVLAVGRVDHGAGTLAQFGADHLQAEVVVEPVHAVHDGVVDRRLGVLLAQREGVAAQLPGARRR